MDGCVNCTYLDLETGDIYGKFYCDKKYERHLATDPACGSFCRAYSRTSSTISNAISYSKDKSKSGCYITTMLCNILSISDIDMHLEFMRKFRNDFLQKDEKYKQLLVEYDIIGPKIAKALKDDPLNKIIAIKIFYKYIVPIIKSIKNGENNEAINLYIEMTNKLKGFYSLDNEVISQQIIDSADINESGHGIYKQKRIVT